MAPVVSEARTLDRFIAPAQEKLWSLARNLWWSWDHDIEHGLFRDLDPVRWRQLNHNPISLLSEIPLAEIERRAGNWCCTAASTTRTGASRNICTRTAPGALRTRVSCGRVRWRTSRRSSDCTNRCRSTRAAWVCWPATTSRALRTWIFRWSAVGLFYGQGYFRQRLDQNGWQQEEYLETDASQLPMEPAIGTNGEPVTVQVRDANGIAFARRSGG